MFFTQELLSRRDSGFGLLWLAATLGPRSNLKKLARRDVMNADISELCDLIIEPAEPLALRLSSNLLVGVARVYKVKHENFVSDITAFSTTLKKAIQDLATGALDLQMGQPTVRPDTVTMAVDPVLATGMNFDDFLESWESAMEEGSDEEYGKKKKRKGKQPAVSVEQRRADAHTLDEDIEQLLSGSQLLSASFDQSFVQGSSSQQEGGPGFDVFQDPEHLDLGAIGDELAAELGEDWGAAPAAAPPNFDQPMDVDDPFALQGMDVEGGDFMFANFGQSDDATTAPRGAGSVATSGRKRAFEEIEPPTQDVGGPVEAHALTPLGASPAPAPAVEEPVQEPAPEVDSNGQRSRKAKRVRLLLDARTELTDEEMKNARAAYLEHQDKVRRELETKRLEKESGKVMDMFWNAPPEFQAPALANIWKQRVKVHIEARTGAMRVEMSNSPPHRSRDRSERPVGEDAGGPDWGAPPDADMGFAGDFGGDYRADEAVVPYQDEGDYQASRRSSEEPGQARRGSAPMSPLGGQFDFNLGRNAMDPASATSASQRSALFPWDNAGPSSSSAGGANFDPAHDRISIGHHEVRIRASPAGGRSRRESSIHSSQPGGRGFSPGAFGRLDSQAPGEDFEFDVPEEGAAPEDQEDTQGDGNLVTLERNSFNFLEYARMQAQTAAQPEGLSFDTIVPKATSTPHVAAAAFYHCLVLATKDLIRVNQPEPYEPLTIQIKG